MKLEKAWQDKLNKLPADIIQRLELEELACTDCRAKRAFMAGLGCTKVLEAFAHNISFPSDWKIFINGAVEKSFQHTQAINVISLEGNFE